MKKVIAFILAVFFVVLSPLSAFASTTESAIMFASEDQYSASLYATPSGNDIVMSSISSSNGHTLTYASSVNLVDASSSSLVSQSFLSGNISDLEIGSSFKFRVSDSAGYDSSIDSIRVDMASYSIALSAKDTAFSLRPSAVPSQAYVKYTGVYQFKIYDGSISGSGGKRWVYDRPFTIIKPVSVSTSSFGQDNANAGGLNDVNPSGHDLSFFCEFVTVSDLLDIYSYRNDINDYYEFIRNEELDNDSANIEDFVLDVVNIYPRNAEVIILYDVCDDNFVAHWDDNIALPNSLSNNYWHTALSPTLYHGNTTFVNYSSYNHMYSSDVGLFSSIRNGFYDMSRSLSGSLGNIVSNATDNANRIIQNTIQKVDEVKQGVTDVKDSVIETKNSILDLPNKIKDMLLGLIVPSSETMSNKFSEFSNLLEEKLGIIYQVPMMLFDFFDTIVNAATTPQSTLTLPAFQLPWIDGSTLTVWQPMEYKIIPEGMQVLSDLIKTITSMTVVVLTFNSVKRAYERFLRS